MEQQLAAATNERQRLLEQRAAELESELAAVRSAAQQDIADEVANLAARLEEARSSAAEVGRVWWLPLVAALRPLVRAGELVPQGACAMPCVWLLPASQPASRQTGACAEGGTAAACVCVCERESM